MKNNTFHILSHTDDARPNTIPGQDSLKQLVKKAQDLCPIQMVLNSSTNPLQTYFGIFNVIDIENNHRSLTLTWSL